MADNLNGALGIGFEPDPGPPPPVPSMPAKLNILSNDGATVLYSALVYDDSGMSPIVTGAIISVTYQIAYNGLYAHLYNTPDPSGRGTRVFDMSDYTGLSTVMGASTPDITGGTISKYSMGDKTYYVVEAPKTYTVSYSTEHGTTPSPVSDVTEITAEMLPTLTDSAYDFVGWYYESSFTTPAQVGDELTDDVTLYARWSLKTYTVSYNANGGKGTIASQTKTHGVDLTLSDGTGFSMGGFTLKEWNTSASGEGTTYALGATYSANANVTVYAVWQSETYTIEGATLKAIGDTIRSKTGEDAELSPDDMADTITDELVKPQGTKNITTNGTLDVSEFASANVNVPAMASFVAATMPSSDYWRSVTYGNGKFVAVSSSYKAAYSTDGINWTAATMPSSTGWFSVAYGSGKFVAVGVYNGTAKAAYSTNGINWTAATTPPSEIMSQIAYGKGMFVAVALSNGNYGTTAASYSADGINWESASLPSTSKWGSIVYGNGKFVAISLSGYTAYSTDGINWTQGTNLSNSNSTWSIAYGGDKYVATNYIDETRCKVAYSTDGISWSEQTLTGDTPRQIVYGNGVFVATSAAGSRDFGWYCYDGISWLPFTLPRSERWGPIAYGAGKFVLISADTTGSNKAAYCDTRVAIV